MLNDLFDYENIKIYQNKDYFKFSIDSILLAEFVKINKNDKKVLDLCTGNIPVPLVLSYKNKDLKITGIEIQKEIFELASKTLEFNNKKNINIINDNINNVDKYIEKNSIDIITCNPPYFKNSLKNDNNIKSIARHEVFLELEDIFKISVMYLKDNKSLYMIHKPERLDEIFYFSNKYNIKLKEILFVNNKNNIPILVLIKAVKNSKYGLKIKCINEIEKYDSYKNIFEVIK